MRRPFHRCVACVGFVGLFVALAGCTPHYLGPWSPVLQAAPPSFQWAGGEGGGMVRSLYYTGEPYQGHPTRVFAYYAVPDGEGKRPAMVLVHGGGGKAFREWAELWAKRGYAAIAMDLAGRGPDGQRLPDGGPDQTDAEKFGLDKYPINDIWTYHAVADVIRANSLLRTMPEVDAERIGVTGISWGGYLTCIVAGVDERFKVAVPVYGCGFLHEDSVWTPILNKMPLRGKWVEYFDPSRYLPGCRMPILFMNGTNDFAYPLDSYRKSYRLVRGPRTLCVTVKMPHSHPDGWAPKEIGLFVDSVLTGGKPLATIQGMTRHAREVVVRFTSTVPIKEAALHYTTQGGPWQQREWITLPARLENGRATATLPTEALIVYFLTLKDERDAIVSTEHEELGAPSYQ